MSAQPTGLIVAVEPAPQAAGAVPWRRRQGELQVALVHRVRYDDWSWPKGKLDPGEDWPVAAVREVFEETGLRVRLGLPLPQAEYAVVRPTAGPQVKQVRYWAGEIIGGNGVLVNEIDQVDWLSVAHAYDRLTYARDHAQLLAVARAERAGDLATWPLIVVRHAHAQSRGSWKKPDRLRPLDRQGQDRSRALVDLLAAYAPRRVVSSPSARCTDTIGPYARSADRKVHLRAGLSEEGYELDPGRALTHLNRLLERGRAALLCSHGPVLPELLDRLASTARTDLVRDHLAAAGSMRKGEALVAHLVGTGEHAQVLAVERHLAE